MNPLELRYAIYKALNVTDDFGPDALNHAALPLPTPGESPVLQVMGYDPAMNEYRHYDVTITERWADDATTHRT